MERVAVTILAFTLFGAGSARSACYEWTNEAPQTVVLNFIYLDGALNPTGQRTPQVLRSGGIYQSCAGYNAYYNVQLRNGRYNGWDADTIFGIGYHDDDKFTITANLSVLKQQPHTENVPGKISINSAAIALDAKYLPTGNMYSVQVSDLICPSNTSVLTVYGGSSSSFAACTNSADFARIAIKNLTTNSQVVQCGQVHGGDTCIVP